MRSLDSLTQVTFCLVQFIWIRRHALNSRSPLLRRGRCHDLSRESAISHTSLHLLLDANTNTNTMSFTNSIYCCHNSSWEFPIHNVLQLLRKGTFMFLHWNCLRERETARFRVWFALVCDFATVCDRFVTTDRNANPPSIQSNTGQKCPILYLH